jgi:hypothetical protein
MKLLLSMLYKQFEVEGGSKTEDVRDVFALAIPPPEVNFRLRSRTVSATTTFT